MATIDETLKRLSTSKFRSSFKLTKKEKLYIELKGMDTIRSHAKDFVKNKLAPAQPINDGHQTPMHGHPVFKAMHATACCCRGCMEKWYHVQQGIVLSEEQQIRVVNLLISWIESQK